MKAKTILIFAAGSMIFANTAWSNELEDIGMQVTDNPNANAEQAYREISLPGKASSTGVERSATGLDKANEVRANRGSMNENAVEAMQNAEQHKQDAMQKAQDAKSNAQDNAVDGINQAQESAADQASEALQAAQEAQQNGLNTAEEHKP